MAEGTAVARTEDSDLTETGKQEVRSIQQAGKLAVARQRALNDTTRQLAGMKFGDVTGDKLSPETRYAIAQLCTLTGANPGLHLYILGGRAYLNAEYWGQVVAQQPRSLGFEQFNVSVSATEELRKQARQLVQDAEELGMPELREEAVKVYREAARLDTRRVHYGIPATAQAAYETVIRRYSEHAPLAQIAAGVVGGSPFVVEVREANWAGGKQGDPVGNARPAETARSRSLRRAAVKAYATTLQPMEEEIRKLEDAIEAEFTVIAEDRDAARAALPAAGEQQAVRIGAGEPEAARAVEAQPLPVEDVGGATVVRRREPAGNARKERDKFREGCRLFGIDNVDLFITETLGRDAETLEDYQALNLALAKLADGDAQDEPQEGLGL